MVSPSKVTVTVTPPAPSVNSTTALRSPKVYSMSRCGTTFVYSPSKSNPNEPSLASIREQNRPPGRRSTVAAVVCQSAEAAFQSLMSSGVV